MPSTHDLQQDRLIEEIQRAVAAIKRNAARLQKRLEALEQAKPAPKPK